MSDTFDVVFDIETKTATLPQKGFDVSGMEISLVCAYRSDTDKIESFWEDDLPKLEELFDKADRIIGFNSWGFDEPVLNKYFQKDVSVYRSIDMLEAVRKSIGTRIKLDILAQATLGIGKSGSGLDAVKYWEEGNLKDLEKYCIQDVAVTKDLYYYGINEGKIAYINGMDETVFFDVSWVDGERIPESQNTDQQSMF